MKRLRIPFRDHRPPAEGHFAVRWRVDCATTAAGPEPKFHANMPLPGYYVPDIVLGPYKSHEQAKDVAAAMDTGERDVACFWGWSNHRKPTFPRTDSERPARNPLFVVNGPWDKRHPWARLAAMTAQAGGQVIGL